MQKSAPQQGSQESLDVWLMLTSGEAPDCHISFIVFPSISFRTDLLSTAPTFALSNLNMQGQKEPMQQHTLPHKKAIDARHSQTYRACAIVANLKTKMTIRCIFAWGQADDRSHFYFAPYAVHTYFRVTGIRLRHWLSMDLITSYWS